MNTLFIGPYRQTDGWGMATRAYIKALGTKNINLTTRPVYLGNPDPSFNDDEIIKYEHTRFDHYDVVIQKTLPHCLFLNKTFGKNIGLFVLETNDISKSSCVQDINRMDELWVPSEIEKKCLIKSGITKPIKVISQPLDTDFISANKDHKLDFASVLDGMYKFYFVGENNDRKNILDLVLAFSLAFDYTDPVCLIIKTSKSGMNPTQAREQLETEINNFKMKLSLGNKYKKEFIITDNLSYKDIIGLHNACDCFVAPSYGEAFCRPAAEALVLGKTPIVNQNTGMKDYINDSNGFLVKSHKVPVIVNDRPLSKNFDIYNASEYWYKPDIYDMIDKLRLVYNMNKNKDKELTNKQNNGMSSVNNFSYTNIGKNLCI